MLREYTIRVEREADGRFVTSLTDSDHGYSLTSRADTQEDALGILGLLLDRLTDATDTDEDGLPAAETVEQVAHAPHEIAELLRLAINRGESVYVTGTKADRRVRYYMRLIKPVKVWYGRMGGTYVNFTTVEGERRTLLVDLMTYAQIA